MKKRLANLLLRSLLLILLFSAVLAGSFTAGAENSPSADPAEGYIKQTAPYEDEDIELWFEHSFKKVLTQDITPSGMDTYSVYMAKNEIENAQFVLFSEETKSRMSAGVSDFTNEKGDTIPAEIYYQMYITTENLDKGSVIGCTEENSIIREGETPDPIAPLDRIGTFQLNGGKSQAFLIRIESDENTPSGWYSAKLDIKDAEGRIVKTATVYCYVWDFALSEETALQSSFYIANRTTYGGTYEAFYEYLVENRLMPMDMPGGFYATNPYLTDERVSAVRVTATGGGYAGDTYVDPTNTYY
ncbi:MAG: hypothetical protein E7575_06775, partial [Ruminococcaceae bacterium]|nr:hypothetical protein [Oscillospiraceae bacterium]